MKIAFIEDQQQAIKFLLAEDMLDKIKPADPDANACTGFFELSGRPGVYCIADRSNDRWKVAIVEGLSTQEACELFQFVAKQLNQGHARTPRIYLTPRLNAATN